MKWFGPGQWLFSLKLFITAMIAYAISVRMGLPQSYWSIVTCCVVMNPATGVIRSKGLYRLVGTVTAGICSIVLAAVFANASVFIIISTGLLATLAFGIALLDRTPRAYGFQLFGVTLLLVAVAGVNHPENMFDTAIARVCEITVGIICCTVIDSILAPRSMKNNLLDKLNAWLTDFDIWIGDALCGNTQASERDRQKIIADITALSLMARQLIHDPMVSKQERQGTFAIQQHLLRLIPLLSAIETGVSEHIIKDTALASWLKQAANYAHEGIGPGSLNGLLDWQEAQEGDTDFAWRQVQRASLIAQVKDALRIWSDIHQINNSIRNTIPTKPGIARRIRQARPFPLPPDTNLAVSVACGILLAYTLLCLLWWATGWQQGATAVLMGVCSLAFFGNLDEAGKFIKKFGTFSAIALLIGGVLSYGLLPMARDYPSFVVVMALVMLPLGAWAATNPLAILLMAISLSMINLQAQYSPPDFGFFLDSAFATELGIVVGYYCVHAVRRLGASHAVERFSRMQRADVIALTHHVDEQSRERYSNLALDRIAAVNSREASAGKPGHSALLFKWLRVGIAVATIRYTARQCGEGVAREADALLDAVREDVSRETASPTVLEHIDRTLTAAWHTTQDLAHPMLRGLTGLRLVLFNNAPAWEP